MTALGGTMSQPDTTSLPRSFMRLALVVMSFGFAIFGTTAVLHAPAFTLEELTVLLPSVILMLAPHVMTALDAAWELSLFGSAVITVLVAGFCTALFFFGLGSLDDSRAGPAQSEIKPVLLEVLPAG